MDPISTRFATQTVILASKYAIAIGCVILVSQTGYAQSWPVNNPDAYESVQQYSRRYPLKEREHAQAVPSEDVEQKSAVTTDAVFEFDGSDCRRCRPAIETRTPSNRCNSCSRPWATQPRCACDLPGLKGRPYVDNTPGGCLCEKKKPPKHPEFSVFWPRPFSAKLDEHFSETAAARFGPCQKKRCVDVFDSLANFKLINYHRTDNGYCGRGSDPYGCLGEEKFFSRVAGVDYRIPGEPASPGNR